MAKNGSDFSFIQLLLFYLLLCTSILVEGSKVRINRNSNLGELKDCPKRRWLIGSMAPICTHNECRGCRHGCTAELVPVDGDDPINSSYHYKCICHK